MTRHPARKLAAIYAGGVVGALIRVGLAQAFPPGAGAWPWPTFAVNLAGALLLGYFFGLLRDRPGESLAHPFLGIGICGTLTTFSTLQLELYELVDGGDVGLAPPTAWRPWRSASSRCGRGSGWSRGGRGWRDERLGRDEGRRAMSVAGWIAVGLLGGVAAALRFLVDAEISARAPAATSRSGSSSSTSPAPWSWESSPGRRCTARRW